MAVGAYFLTVLNRSSLAVTVLEAGERFGASASQLAGLTIAQIGVYALLQLPVGVLLDRFRPRKLLVAGLWIMASAQLTFAWTTTYEVAAASRLLLGAGDALMFASVLRLVATWFEGRRGVRLRHLTGHIGQAGTIAATTPMLFALVHLGWSLTFVTLASLGVAVSVLVAFTVKDGSDTSDGRGAERRPSSSGVRQIVRNPGVRLAAWAHLVSQFPVTVLAMLWGYPFLVSGEGLSPELASTLLMLIGFVWVGSGQLIAVLVSRLPYWRARLVLGVVWLTIIPWTAVLLHPRPAPTWLLIVLICTVSLVGPVTMVAFDLARTFTPASAIGKANAIVNAAGFTGSLIAMLMIGICLDVVEPRGSEYYDLRDFRVAMSTQYVLWLVGTIQVLRHRVRALNYLDLDQPGVLDEIRAGRSFDCPEDPHSARA